MDLEDKDIERKINALWDITTKAVEGCVDWIDIMHILEGNELSEYWRFAVKKRVDFLSEKRATRSDCSMHPSESREVIEILEGMK